jgi:N-acetylglucosaminyldiphosphoundecaprenol N-acetyl-beta-D-mannosaminyltransferase
VASAAVAAAEEAAVVEGADSASVPADRILLLGMPLDRISRQETLTRLFRATQSSAPALFTVATLNPEYVMAARSAPEFRKSIECADLIVCDGIGTLLAARALHGRPASVISRLTGLDLTLLLARWSAFDDSGGLFLLGGKNASAAARELIRLAPNARIAGDWSGGTPSPATDEESIRRIAESGATVVLVAYGAPGQVHWIERNRHSLASSGVKVVMGVGGVLDYLSGDAALAPPAVRRAGLEWFYRLLREPWRARRQAVLPAFALLVAREALRSRLVSTDR